MKKLFALAGVALAMNAFGAEGPPQTVAARFGWLAGCWAGESGGTAFREMWTVASPDLMVGMGVTTQASRPAQFEYLRIQGSGGRQAYVAQPGGAPPTEFALSSDSPAGTAIFTNMQHDFPKRVGYRRLDAGSLLAWIDGGSDEKRIEFPMKRAACPGGV